MTGRDGRWECEGDSFFTQVGSSLPTFRCSVRRVHLLFVWVWTVFRDLLITVLPLVLDFLIAAFEHGPGFLRSAADLVFAALIFSFPAFGLIVAVYYFIRFFIWISS